MTELLHPAALLEEKNRLSLLLDEALADLYQAVNRYAEADHALRLAEASAYLAASGTVPEREAHVKQATLTQRREAKLAEGLVTAGKLNVQAKMAQLSAWQTGTTLSKTEMQLAR